MADKGVFYKIDNDGYIISAIATDDFTIIADPDKSVDLLKQQIHKHFEIMDLRHINWLLGVKITQNLERSHNLSLSQQSYIEQILTCFGLEESRTATTPLEPGIDLTPDSPSVSSTLLTPSEKTKYCEMIGSLMYASVMTCSDITFAVSSLSQYLETPFEGCHLCFSLLIGHESIQLVLGGSQCRITSHSDAYWASHLH